MLEATYQTCSRRLAAASLHFIEGAQQKESNSKQARTIAKPYKSDDYLQMNLNFPYSQLNFVKYVTK